MRFIVDAQLPKSLSNFLNRKGFDAIHTLDMPFKNRSKDFEIIDLAKKEHRIVITKDIDFLQSFLMKHEPQKLILVRTGNIPNSHLIRLFDENLKIISEMISRSNLIEMHKTEITEHQ